MISDIIFLRSFTVQLVNFINDVIYLFIYVYCLQSLEATKKQLRSSIKQSIEEAMESMTTELVEHWTSNECQSNFANIE